jgi:hypothetical protein
MGMMESFKRLFRGKRELPVDPHTPHPFRSSDDAGLGAAAVRTGGSRGGQALGMNMAVTGNFQRGLRCGVPGCGRDRDEAIHFPEG